MKFSNSLKFNAVPEWQDNYVNYPALKKLIYSLEDSQLKLASSPNTDVESSRKTRLNRFKQKLLRKKLKEDENEASSSSLNSTSAVPDIELQKLPDFKTDTYDKDDSASTFSVPSTSEAFNPTKTFTEALEKNLAKINGFYIEKEAEVFLEHDQLIHDMTESNFLKHGLSRKSSVHHHQNVEQAHSITHTTTDIESQEHPNANEDDEDDDEEEEEETNVNSALLGAKDVSDDFQKLISFKKRATFLFVSLSELKSFIELNKIGFTKISKKFDKELNTSIKKDLIDSELFYKESYVFQHTTMQRLDSKISETVHAYATLTNTSNDACRTELKSYLREHIVWERTTVWKDMLGLENGMVNPDAVVKTGDEAQFKHLLEIECYHYPLPFTLRFKKHQLTELQIPRCLFTRRTFKLAIIITVTGILLGVDTFTDKEQHRCMALLACVALMWASEAIPLFATAMLVPLLTVTFKVLKDDDGSAMAATAASQYILGVMWSSTIMLLIGGFTLAGALSKYNIAKVLASYILSAAGTNPRVIILAVMFVATFLSMWISNVATPVLTYSLMQGLIKSQPTESPFVQALLLSIAFASNIGGMASPIASPQNMIAVEYMSPNPGWGKWFGVAIPVCILSNLLIWALMIFTFDVKSAKVKAYKPITERFTLKQWYISIVTVATILLWCLLTKLEDGLGEAGQVSIFSFVLFFGTGILTAQDLNNFPWSIVVLAMGGIALGKAVSSSGLLATIATALQHRIDGYNIYVIMLIFGILILVIATFVSHTVAVLIIVPLVKEVGESLATPHPTLLVFSTTLIASAAMALPTSGFPNVTAISMTDEVGRPYLRVSTFITRGIPASLLAYVVIITVGYGILSSFGF